MTRQHHAGHAGALGGAQNRAEVARIGDAVERQQERYAVAPSASGVVVGPLPHEFAQLGLGQGVGQSDHSLR